MNQVMRAVVLALAVASLAACAGAGSRPSPSAVAAAPTVAAVAAAPVSGLSGVWTGAIKESETDRGHPITLTLKVEGEAVTGTLKGGPPNGAEQPVTKGRLQGDQLSFSVKAQGPEGEPFLLAYKGKVAGNKIRGTLQTPMGTPSWEVTKQ